MRRISEERTATLHRRNGLVVEGAMHVRGFDARVRGRGVRFERRNAGGVTVRRGDDVRVIPMARGAGAGRRVLMLAMPVAALLIGRLARRGRTT